MNKIRQVKELNKRELEAGITPEGSWHADYRDTVRGPTSPSLHTLTIQPAQSS